MLFFEFLFFSLDVSNGTLLLDHVFLDKRMWVGFLCFLFSAKVRFHLVWSKGLEREETDRRGEEGSVTVNIVTVWLRKETAERKVASSAQAQDIR